MKYYEEIKNQLIENEINRKVKNYAINKSDLETYYNVGKLLSDAGKHYGEGIIKEYSKRLTKELGKGYSTTRLRYIRRFYIFSIKYPSVTDKLTYTHYCEIIWLDDSDMIDYYINISINQNLSVRQLREKIKFKEYERLPAVTKEKLKIKEKMELKETIPNPIIINNTNNYEEISEKVLQKIIMEDIQSFLESLGDGYTFIRNEYKIRIDNQYNYIDILLFNINYNCYVVVELKIKKLDKRDIGQVEFYMDYIDKHIKKINHDKTIGLIICREDDKYIIEYATDRRIVARRYEIK